MKDTPTSKFSGTTFFYLCLIICGILEAGNGCLQLYDFSASNNSLYQITGSFQNPGPFAGFLAAILPVALYTALNPYKGNRLLRPVISIFSGLCIFLILTLLPATMSRAAWLAACIGTGIILADHYRIIPAIKQYILLHKKQAIFYFTAIILFLTIAGAGIYYLKKDSADGRLLMWKVTTRIITGHPLTGVGPGNFAGAYGQAQATYFAQGNGTPQEEYVAGSPEYAFNEFLQITAEYGITGLFLFVSVVILAFRNAYKNRQTGIIGSLAAFLAFACFSYPFSVWQSVVLFIGLIGMTFRYEKMKNRKWTTIASVIIGMSLIISAIWAGKKWEQKQQIITQWKEEQTYYNMEIYEETVDNYRKLYPHLQNEPKFLFEFGQCLSKTKSYEESNRILLEGAKQSSDPMFWNIMGKNHQALHHYQKAEQCFTHAHHMVPNRLYPLYLLANLYFDNGQFASGIITAQQVIDKAPKVMSSAVQEMKAEMKEKLDSAQETIKKEKYEK